MTKLPGIYISAMIEQNQEDFTFIDNPFISVEELFPCWISARPILEDFCNKTKSWIVTSEFSNVNILLDFPMAGDLISGKMIPMYILFPEEDRPKVIEILNNLMEDYKPNLDQYYKEKITENSLICIENEFKRKNHQIINCGGRDILDEMKFRLGIN